MKTRVAGKDDISGRFTQSHGLTYSPEYRAWGNAIDRCENNKSNSWSRYGGRGIRVCGRWRQSFEAFLLDMGNRPSDRHSLDRIDNDGNYEPTNCRWATKKEQAANRHNTVVLDHCGYRTLEDFARFAGLPLAVVKNRHRRGWSAERMANTPKGRYVRACG